MLCVIKDVFVMNEIFDRLRSVPVGRVLTPSWIVGKTIRWPFTTVSEVGHFCWAFYAVGWWSSPTCSSCVWCCALAHVLCGHRFLSERRTRKWGGRSVTRFFKNIGKRTYLQQTRYLFYRNLIDRFSKRKYPVVIRNSSSIRIADCRPQFDSSFFFS